MVSSAITLEQIQVCDYIGFQTDPSLVLLVKSSPREKLLFADKIKKTNMYEWT